MINGVEVGTKDIEVKVEKKAFNKSQGGIALGGIQIPVDGSDLGWEKSRDNAINNFSTKISYKLKQAAIAQGYSEQDAENAAKTLESYFSAAMKALDYALKDGLTNTYDRTLKGQAFTYTKYTNEGTIDVTSGDQSTVRAERKEGFVDEYSDLGGLVSGTGIYIGCDITGKDDFWVFVNGARMIDLFASFLG